MVDVELASLGDAWAHDWKRDLRFLEQHLVRVPGSSEPFTSPYLPWIGPRYPPGGILLMATAQNLAQFQGETDADLARWRQATGWPDDTLDRMRRWELEQWRDVPIQPWMDGIMTALAGVWMLARSNDAPVSLDDIASQVSVTNFFKHSLRKEGKARARDLNPRDLETALRGRYLSLTRKLFVEPEVEALAPAVIIAFSSLGKLGAFDGLNTPVVLANDPTWIKQGMSGVARKGGSWQLAVERAAIPESVHTLVNGWVDQLNSPYSAGKRESARIYLLHNFLTMRGMAQHGARAGDQDDRRAPEAGSRATPSRTSANP